MVANISSTSPEGEEITDALKRAYTILDNPFEQLDLNQLSTVLVNHPIFEQRLGAYQCESLKNRTRRVQGEAATQEFDYLTMMRTQRIIQRHGTALLRTAREKAHAENREVTAEEMKALTEQNYGVEPWIPSGGGHVERSMEVISIKLNGDIAEVYHDTGAIGATAILVRIEGKWYLAGFL